MDPNTVCSIEVVFSPKLFPDILTRDNYVVVLADILRATTTICTAFENGVKEIIPVSTTDEARKMKEKGFMVASEQDGLKLDFADFGNSAFSFTRDRVEGKTLVYCTTNGTRALEVAKGSEQIVIGSFINISALTGWLMRKKKNVVILCSGWKQKFCLEDTLFAGALATRLMAGGEFTTACDSTHASIDLWKTAENDVLKYLEKAAHRQRLQKLGLDDVIPYSFIPDQTSVVPVFDGKAIRLE
jgi:2-phosphosulfolactate phosphatase